MTDIASLEVENPDVIDPDEPRVAVHRHGRGTRWTHWINGPLLLVMIWSGLRIYWADLRDPVGVGIAGWHWFDLFPDWFNEALGLERRLARGLAFHLTFGWLFALNGAVYAAYSLVTGSWRRLVPGRGAGREAAGVVLHDLGLKRDKPEKTGTYNAAQRISYSLILGLGVVAMLTGFAIYKPTQLSPLTTAFGGYESARTIHFGVTVAFVAFFVVHILQVARAGFGNFWSMVTGWELLPARASAELTKTTTEQAEKVTR